MEIATTRSRISVPFSEWNFWDYRMMISEKNPPQFRYLVSSWLQFITSFTALLQAPGTGTESPTYPYVLFRRIHGARGIRKDGKRRIQKRDPARSSRPLPGQWHPLQEGEKSGCLSVI